MPVLPSPHTASSSRQPRHPRSSSNNAASIADTSSRIRLRPDGTPAHDNEDFPVSDNYSPQPQPQSPWLLLPNNPTTSPPHLSRRDNTLQPQPLAPRQYFFALPLSYHNLNNGPSSGTVVGIVLGSVFGYLLLIYLINSALTGKPGQTRYIEGDASEIVVTRRSDRSSGKKRRRKPATAARSTRRSEMTGPSSGSSASVQMPPPPMPRQPSPRRTERIIREEVRVRQEARQPPVQMPMPPGPPDIHETINININDERPERRVDGDDTVEVIEEGSEVSAAPQRRNRRESSRGAYRTVDPQAYGGGRW